MDKQLKVALEILAAYRTRNELEGHRPWGVEQYMAGFVGDVGDLSKLVMASNNYRDYPDLRDKLEHELSDCLWSLFVISNELGIDLATVYDSHMSRLLERVTREGS